jgi:putative endonuclease
LRGPEGRGNLSLLAGIMNRYYFIYLLTNKHNTTVYVGVTNDLKKRVWQHKEKLVDGFTKRFNLNKLVYYEVFENPEAAITREKQIKSWNRTAKLKLIRTMNKAWVDLYTKL